MTPSSWTERRCDECGAPSAARIDGRDLCVDHLSTRPHEAPNRLVLLAGGAE